ncbi:hypothetical protein F4802DRAFT_586611 [Xylaria palmicola]|nr:hypothetical protein F4802DRAFT_586611 [Xylaria palmicola]
MHLHSFIAGVGLAATTNALLLPPDVHFADDTITTLPVPVKSDVDAVLDAVPDTITLDLECPGCHPFGRKHHHHKEIPSHLKLDFSIEPTDGPDRLTLNGFELYPNLDPLRSALMAPVIPDMAHRRMGVPPHVRGGPKRPQKVQPLGFGVERVAMTTDDEDMQLISIKLQFLQVGDSFVEGIPDVQVDLVKSPSGKLAIGAVQAVGPKIEEAVEGQMDCSSMYCELNESYKQRVSEVAETFSQTCMGRGNTDMGCLSVKIESLLELVIIVILAPVLIGMLGGFMVYMIGSLLVHTALFYRRRVFIPLAYGTSHGCRYARRAARREQAAGEEKVGLLVEQADEKADEKARAEAPPAYV